MNPRVQQRIGVARGDAVDAGGRNGRRRGAAQRHGGTPTPPVAGR